MGKRLGRGLATLVGEATATGPELATLPVDQIRANRLQPRQEFEPRALDGLAQSIRAQGVLQPIVVRPAGTGYELIAGERRLRAARQAGLTEIPAVVKEVREEDALEISLIENIQREDLNPLERARGYLALIKGFNYTQERAARRLGIDRSSLANQLRLLDLPGEIQELVSRGTISMGHARALLGEKNKARQLALAREIAARQLSVRAAEALVGAARPAGKQKRRAGKSAHLASLEQRLRAAVGCRVQLKEGRRKGSGTLTIQFNSHEDFERLLDMLGVTLD